MSNFHLLPTRVYYTAININFQSPQIIFSHTAGVPPTKNITSPPHPTHHPPHYPPASVIGSHSGGERHHRRGDTPCSPGMMPAIRTPPMPPIPALEMDHSHRGGTGKSMFNDHFVKVNYEKDIITELTKSL